MRASEEIIQRREALRFKINVTNQDAERELLRQKVFVLDEILGVFDSGEIKTRTEIFTKYQILQTHEDNILTDEYELIKHKALLETYKWVLS